MGLACSGLLRATNQRKLQQKKSHWIREKFFDNQLFISQGTFGQDQQEIQKDDLHLIQADSLVILFGYIISDQKVLSTVLHDGNGATLRLLFDKRLYHCHISRPRNKVNLPFRVLGLYFQCEPVAEKTVGGCDTRLEVWRENLARL